MRHRITCLATTFDKKTTYVTLHCPNILLFDRIGPQTRLGRQSTNHNTKIILNLLYFQKQGSYIKSKTHKIPVSHSKLISWGKVLTEKLTVAQLAKKFPELSGPYIFITVFTTARQWSPSWVW